MLKCDAESKVLEGGVRLGLGAGGMDGLEDFHGLAVFAALGAVGDRDLHTERAVGEHVVDELLLGRALLGVSGKTAGGA